jgi:hypothetical protein
MSDSNRNKTLSAAQFSAQSVLNVVRDFVEEFAARGELNALNQIITEDEDLLGGVVEQMPERFTEEKLIRPMLEALGYKDIVAQPADLVKDQRTVPDFKTGGVAPSCVCIVEAKKFGEINPSDEQSEVKDEVTEYLGENALAKYKRDLDRQYLMGIGTDGLVWLLYGKNLDTGQQTVVHTVSLREPFRQAVLAEQYEGATRESWVTDQRPHVQEEFVPLFTTDGAYEAIIASLQN